MNALDKLTKARAGLVLDMPFFGSLSLRFTLKEDFTCTSAWTDGRVIGYNPEYISSCTLTETKGVFAHEDMHCAMGHQFRRGQRDHKKWNIACDYAVNGILIAAGVTLPKGALYNPKFDGMSAEAIYPQIPDQPDGGSDPGGCGEVRDAADADGNKASPAEMEHIAAEWKIATAQAAQAARAMGQMPNALDRLVKEIVEPKVDWRETLRRFVQQSAKDDYRWSPPNRRHIHNGLYLPSMHSEKLPPIVNAFDSSGSTQSFYTQFASEMTGVLQEHDTTLHALYCDAEIQGVEVFTRDDLPLILHPRGGGGTDFRPVFEWVAQQDWTPSCLVYLTDMEGTFPDKEPPYPVLWVNAGGRDLKAPFGEVVKI